MKFSKFAEYLTKLEATSKRLELIDIMADLFKNSDASEVGKISYLLQGRVAPFYEHTEFGMSENLVALAIGKAYGKNKEEVIRDYRKLGNMGLAAQDFAKHKKDGGNLSVADVFAQLLKIANTG